MHKRTRSEFESDWKAHGISSGTIDRLKNKEITKMTEIQSSAVGPLMEGKSIIGRAQTGSGKTYAFIVPIVEQFRSGALKSSHKPKAIVLNPTRELVTQT